ncbi:serine hydrolase domain-containing protein [Nocardia sp. CDC153]|uniref:serine hydrolase domain-containing protein n=1 Tax=Nocardia sp. CDC153 TaxID=3112167 RepID=UPI002DBB67F0|nr:serine hydrolase domain-containing protein [Nocardia sp. CDC153]MEC3958895.1 serine hydrolase domain-containing protein [Nocardia sp. CDC153]
MTITLSDQDKSTLRTAAYGTISLMAAASSTPHKSVANAVLALTSATGLVGHVLTARSKDIELTGTTVAELADRVLPALTAAMQILDQRVPAESDNFRGTVLRAVEAAQNHSGNPSSAMAEMAGKVTAALETARSTATSAAGQDRPELWRAIEEIVDSGFIGVSVRVRDERGEWAGSAGAAELGGMTPPPIDGHLRIASNTKTFTAALVLTLVAEGTLGLDTPVIAYLPELAMDERITVRMLLQHTSGIFNFTGELYPDGTIVEGIPAPGTPWGEQWVDDRFHTYRPHELVELALSKPLRFEPGTGWSYSNTNYALARLLIEKVSGRSFTEEMRRLILEPLALSNTVVPDGPEIPEPHAHTYYRYEGRQSPVDITRHDPSWNPGGGDMISTTRDLATFISALNGGELLPTELLVEMRTPLPTGIPGMGYGLGVFVQETACGATVITHNGGHAGFATLMYSTPDGSKAMTASLTCVDDSSMSIAGPFQSAQQRLVNEVFCGGQADPGQPTT